MARDQTDLYYVRQSLSATWERSPDIFDVVIVDEFHHATASTYARLLNHVQPKDPSD